MFEGSTHADLSSTSAAFFFPYKEKKNANRTKLQLLITGLTVSEALFFAHVSRTLQGCLSETYRRSSQHESRFLVFSSITRQLPQLI